MPLDEEVSAAAIDFHTLDAIFEYEIMAVRYGEESFWDLLE